MAWSSSDVRSPPPGISRSIRHLGIMPSSGREGGDVLYHPTSLRFFRTANMVTASQARESTASATGAIAPVVLPEAVLAAVNVLVDDEASLWGNTRQMDGEHALQSSRPWARIIT